MEEIKKIYNTTFCDVLTAVTSASPQDLQPHVFVWNEGESSLGATAGSWGGKQTHLGDIAGDSVTHGKHQVGSFSTLTPAVALSQQNMCKMQGLLVSEANSAGVEGGLKSRRVHCASLEKVSGHKNAADALEGHAGVGTQPLPTTRCVTLRTDVSSSSFDINTWLCRLN